jgi:2TM domain
MDPETSATASDDQERELRKRAEARVEAKEAFRIHLLVFVLVNGFLWAIWAYTGAKTDAPWPIFVTLGWGIGLVAHWWTVYGQSDTRREAEIQREMRRLRGDDPNR